MEAEFLFVGLGNPGSEYEGSPHNAGFEAAKKLRALCRGPRFSVKGNALISSCRWRGNSVLAAMPVTYMNKSGEAVAALLQRLDLPPERLIVCYDDLDLPFGAVRLRPHGGAGGHHGMESILERLGTDRFPRIRIGVKDDSVDKAGVVDYLLAPLGKESRQLLEEAALCAAKAALDAVSLGWNKAMSAHNRSFPDDPGGQGSEAESKTPR